MKRALLAAGVAVLVVGTLAGCHGAVDPTTDKGAAYVLACHKAGGEITLADAAPGSDGGSFTGCVFFYPALPGDGKLANTN